MVANWTNSHVPRAVLLKNDAHVYLLSGTKACLPRLSQINVSSRTRILESKLSSADFVNADIFEANFQDSKECFMAVDELEMERRDTIQGVAEYYRLLSLDLWRKRIAHILQQLEALQTGHTVRVSEGTTNNL